MTLHQTAQQAKRTNELLATARQIEDAKNSHRRHHDVDSEEHECNALGIDWKARNLKTLSLRKS